jgi:hypothetical protein
MRVPGCLQTLSYLQGIEQDDGIRLIDAAFVGRRIRVWDYMLSADGPPDREIVHSHDFNRYLTPFRAEWDPKDPSERTFVVGRRAPHCMHHPVQYFFEGAPCLMTVPPFQCCSTPKNETFAARMLALLAALCTGLWDAQPVVLLRCACIL